MPTHEPGDERVLLVTGVNGQVGFELVRALQGLGRVVGLDRSRCDLSDLDGLRRVVRDVRPDVIVNAAAYTAVDRAEEEFELAMRINGEAPAVLAEESKRLGAALIHYSTDYVFSGAKTTPYLEDDATDPQNAYGRTKLAGEQAVSASGAQHLVLRTSWVYGLRGKNFLLTMLRLGAQRPELKVVADQFGAPTWSNTIAALTAHVVAQGFAARHMPEWWAARTGTYHLTAAGSTSWHGFASAIFAEINSDELSRVPQVLPISTAAYPTPAKRPANSRLSGEKLTAAFGLRVPRWDDALRLCMQMRETKQ
ncbi:dTDP-4-dehydrorhamnose reductase [Trinickia acidisoli]|uniref:dTDP-4-dehydrorhamnose reductase n=1 Tax=Trinickia acidisoli TaxID=2767482 RepID=UPI001A8C7AD8|nr:dTDP-4-dehydrorhamnose reductase [Trinickia acidisoli]